MLLGVAKSLILKKDAGPSNQEKIEDTAKQESSSTSSMRMDTTLSPVKQAKPLATRPVLSPIKSTISPVLALPAVKAMLEKVKSIGTHQPAPMSSLLRAGKVVKALTEVDKKGAHYKHMLSPSEYFGEGYSAEKTSYFKDNSLSRHHAKTVYAKFTNWFAEHPTFGRNLKTRRMVCLSVLPIQLKATATGPVQNKILVACSGTPGDVEIELKRETAQASKTLKANNELFRSYEEITQSLNKDKKPGAPEYVFCGTAYKGFAHIVKEIDQWRIQDLQFQKKFNLNESTIRELQRYPLYKKECAEYHYMYHLAKLLEKNHTVTVQGCSNVKVYMKALRDKLDAEFLDCCGPCQLQKEPRFKFLTFMHLKKQLSDKMGLKDSTLLSPEKAASTRERYKRNSQAVYYPPLCAEHSEQLKLDYRKRLFVGS